MSRTIGTPAPPPPEGRVTRRQRVLLAGKIAYGDGRYTLDCSIRDLSPTGARLSIRGSAVAPKAFYLLDLRSGMAHDCEVAWRKGAEIGVRFRASMPVAEITDANLAYLRKLYGATAPREWEP